MKHVITPRFTVNKDDIEENQNELTQMFFEDFAHERLDGGGRIGETERHNQKFKMPMMCSKGRLLYIILIHSYLMISKLET